MGRKGNVKLKRQYVPYWEWEDWLNGMWNKSQNEEQELSKAIEFTGNHVLYGAAMGEVLHAWPRTMLNNLTNTGINRRAFLGHCAVCFKIGIGEEITRKAWGFLTPDQQRLADAEATKWIKFYEEKNK